MLEKLFISKVRIKILDLFLKNPEEKFFVRQIQRAVGEEINAVRRELGRLYRLGLLRREPRGNRLYYQVRRDFPLFDELLALLAKEKGLAREILDQRKELGKIKYAFISRAFVLGRVASAKDVDLMIVGDVEMSRLEHLVKTEEEQRGYEINYTVMSGDEFATRKERMDKFLTRVFLQGKIMLMGDEDEMVGEAPG